LTTAGQLLRLIDCQALILNTRWLSQKEDVKFYRLYKIYGSRCHKKML